MDAVMRANGPVLVLGAADTGKTTLVVAMARAARESGARAAILDADVGQSEFGPPGMMDLVEADNSASAKWKARAHWFVGSDTPYGVLPQMAVGARRLADQAQALDLHPLLVDTTSFVHTLAGHTLKDLKVDALRPALIVAIQWRHEMERWLRGSGVPIHLVNADPAVRSKPEGLRSARRATRVSTYFREAPEHEIRLLDKVLRGTRLGFGQPMTPSEYAQASHLLGTPVVHGERSGPSIAFWTRGPARQDPARAAVEFRAQRVITLDANVWTNRCAGLIAPNGLCLALGRIVKVDWDSLTATVRAPVWSVAEASVLSLGTMRFDAEGAKWPEVPTRDA